ncbi:MAG: DNA helicase RecQ, partial [Lachnospiraceae bacterium]
TDEYIEDTEFVVFDLETTGIRPMLDEIIEISALKVKDRRIVEEFSTLVRPSICIPKAATAVNGITDKMVCHAPDLKTAMKEFMKFIGQEILVGHNIHSFDMNFIYDAAMECFQEEIHNDYIDTLYLARECLPNLKHHKLSDISQYFEIDTTGAHRALNDCIMNQKCYEKMAAISLVHPNLKKEVMKKYFGYDNFRGGQEVLIDTILQGTDVLGIMPTGAGKSLCYQIPALMLPGITLVISPLISLMKDQVRALNQAGIHAAYINSSLTENQIATALRRAKEGAYKIIYVAPERLQTATFLDVIRAVKISMITVDEAHCISQWGQDFRPSYLNIIELIKNLPVRPVVSGFTATATEEVKEDIICVLGLKNPKVEVTGFDRPNLYFEVKENTNKDQEVRSYVEEHIQESGIIYCATRKNVEKVYEMLNSYGVPCTHYHAGLSNEMRKENQDAFIFDEKPVMIATNAFGMGIDKSNVRYVIHYNMPQSLENYYQEAGRAGRDGEKSDCILLYSPQDVMINQYLLEGKGVGTELEREELEDIRQRDMQRLRQMTYYCITKNCLREYILNYFGEKVNYHCGNCSNCKQEFEEIEVGSICMDIIRCIQETHQRYGVSVIVGVLRGEKKEKLIANGLNQVSTYGIQRETSEIRLKQIIHEMMFREILMTSNDKYAVLKLGSKAQEIVNGSASMLFKISKMQESSSSTWNSKVSKSVKRSDILT